MSDFDELVNIGASIRALIYQDEEQNEWFEKVIDEFNQSETGEFPEGTLNHIILYLNSLSDTDSKKIHDDVSRIAGQEDNIDNLLNEIFFGGETEDDNIANEEEEEGFIVDDIKDDEDEDRDDNPQSFFDSKISKISNTINISYDVSYLILKKYQWSTNAFMDAWLKSPEQILKAVNLILGSPTFPKVQSPITANLCGKDTCPYCYVENDLLQLYCGHKICKSCFISEITEQINKNNLPICRDTDEKTGSLCNCEIAPSDVKNNITNSKILEKYNFIRLKSECNNCQEATICPVCKTFVTKQSNDVGCHTVKCPNCHYTKCLNCQFEGSHAPLIVCQKVIDFTVTIKNKMTILEQAQKLWYIREERLRFHRRKHQNEFLPYFDNIISQYQKTMAKFDKEERYKINKSQELLQRSREELQQAINTQNQAEIDDLAKKVQSNEITLQGDRSEHKINGQDREKYLTRLKKLKQYYIWSITEERHPFQNGILKFKKKINRLVNQSIVSSINEDKNTDELTKKCPKCGYKIYKQGGCNFVHCNNCHYEFCWICNSKWEAPHGDHHVCPIFSLNSGEITNMVIDGIDYGNKNDTKFYPMPLDLEKMAEFTTWNNMYTEYNKNNKKYEELVDKFAENNDSNSIRNMLIRSLQKENSEETAKNMATQILNDILFAQSILVWGYPQMFYMTKSPVSYKLMEFTLFDLEVSVKQLIEYIQCPDTSVSVYGHVQNSFSYINKKIEVIIKTAENF